MKRRFFIRRLALSVSAVAGAVAGISFFRQFYPPSFVRKQIAKIGNLHEFPVDTFTYLEKYKLYIYRDFEGVQAVSAVCTHLGCILDKSADGFECPCHGSKYDDTGKILSGPAPASLKWYNLHTAQDGKLVVDLNKTVDADFKYRVS